MIVYLIFLIFFIVFFPKDAFAWGPGTHLDVALSVLKSAAYAASPILPMLKKYRDEFIYGMVSADLLVGKKYAGALHHCHNWDNAWQILDRCKTERLQACAYGYLTHLASDIVAHNYYVPYMTIKSYAYKMRQHTYWELRFDVTVSDDAWAQIKTVIKADFDKFDTILEKTLFRPMFSFKTNKRIFNTILLLQNFRQTRKTVKFHADHAEWPLVMSEVRHYKYLMMKQVKDFLINLGDAKCLEGDPSGWIRLAFADEIRQRLRYLSLKKMISDKEIDFYIENIQKELKKHILNPNAQLPVL